MGKKTNQDFNNNQDFYNSNSTNEYKRFKTMKTDC